MPRRPKLTLRFGINNQGGRYALVTLPDGRLIGGVVHCEGNVWIGRLALQSGTNEDTRPYRSARTAAAALYRQWIAHGGDS